MNSQFDAALQEAIKKRIVDIRLQGGVFQRMGWWVRGWYSIRPRAEIAGAWLATREFATRTAEWCAETGHLSKTKLDVLASVFALLECAREERDFAQAWDYVNSADALLPLVVSPEDVLACSRRLMGADPGLPERFRRLLTERDEEPKGILGQLLELQQIGDSLPKDLERRVRRALYVIARGPGCTMQRNYLRDALAVRTFFWNVVNRGVSLKLSLWRAILMRLIFSIFALFVAVTMWEIFHDPKNGWMEVEAELLSIALLGLFGGTLSAFLTVRDSDVTMPSYEVIKTRTNLRMALGAAGALIVYIVGRSILDEDILKMITKDQFYFMSIGIAAGFSERLFLGALERIAGHLQMTGSTQKSGEAEKPSVETTKAEKADET